MVNNKNRRHVKWLYDELPKLEADKVVTGAVSEKIRNYYGSLVDKNAVHPVLAIFYVMGSVLIGLGIILLIGYNWDNIPRLFKVITSLLPVTIGMGAGYFTYKKGMGKSWKEGVAVFWFLSIGATIALISQTYNIHGEIADFFLIWLILGFPVIYVLKSPMAYFLYMAGAVTWASIVQIDGGFATAFWLFIAAAMPFYIKLFIEDRYSPVVIRTSFITAAAFTSAVGLTLEKCVPGLWMIIYSSLFCFIYMLSARLYDDNEPAIKKPYNWFSAVGIAVLMLLLSYDWAWDSIGWNHYRHGGNFYEQAAVFDYLLTVVLPACAVYMMVDVIKSKKKMILDYGASFVIVIACYIFVALAGKVLGDTAVAAALFFINIYIVYLSAVTIKFGIENRHMMTVNSGMFLFGILVLLRFLDMDLSLLIRGVAFIIMGVVFLVSNYYISRRISADEKR
ncbi:MAG TPA: DUF2157 domain-containing protein [Candidatus Goldiibacteriota bacterium]|nr:DUF2157 domain-containing protein [Candidatus Goldiibacteriota bacterium]HPN64508.1 DUF2157 domain-containing protein [Candidatus Goldiibacteriota bacterium]HRQ44128.1 DUF2157 domain-containing protein [Candidatus Goldiibacteriota bacterium]